MWFVKKLMDAFEVAFSFPFCDRRLGGVDSQKVSGRPSAFFSTVCFVGFVVG
jgi:hypothetical protein